MAAAVRAALAIQRLHGAEVQKDVKGGAAQGVASSHEVTVAKVTTTASIISPNPKSSAPLKRGNTHEITNVMDCPHSHPEEAGPARWEFDSDQPCSEAKDGSSSFLGPAALNASVEQEVVESSPNMLQDNHPMAAAISAALAIQRLQGAGTRNNAKGEAGQGVASSPEVAVAKTGAASSATGAIEPPQQQALLQGPPKHGSSSFADDNNSTAVATPPPSYRCRYRSDCDVVCCFDCRAQH
jgi:hypothetical protein